MSFFNYKPKEEKVDPVEEEIKFHTPRSQFKRIVIIEGASLSKVVEDNPELPDARIDIGDINFEDWTPLNYNPETGEIIKENS